jgi:hypothetical protein
MTSQRDLRWRASGRTIADLLQSIFTAELLSPSENLWLVSPWVSDIAVLDNSAGQFASLVPELERAPLRLSELLAYLAEQGTHVRVTVRELERNRPFCTVMSSIAERMSGLVAVRQARDLHEKGLLGDRYYLCGSFNFTFSGISLHEEVGHFITDPATISAHRIALASRWP